MTKTRRVVILGAGGHGRVIAEALLCMIDAGASLSFAGFTDEKMQKGTLVDDGEVLGRDSNLRSLKDEGLADGFIVGVGSVRGGGALRAKVFARAVDAGLEPVTVVHPSAVLSRRVEIGAGSVVMAGAVMNTGCKTGVNCIVNTRASLDHDVHLGDHVHIAPGSVLSGNVNVGNGVLIGVGSAVMQGLQIGNNATIGAGSAVVKSVEADTIVIGTRARVYG